MTLYEKIPDRPYGSLTDKELHKMARPTMGAIIAKRALEAAYGGENEPETAIVDLLADLRHICTRLRLDFADLDSSAQGHYSVESLEAYKAKTRRGK